MSHVDDVLDFRVRFHRDESPMLFRAIAGLDAAPGLRKRNLFVRQLMEMGLIVMEERMRRQDGLSTRVSGGLADELTGAAAAMTRTFASSAAAPATPRSHGAPATGPAHSADPAAVDSVQMTAASSQASAPVGASRPDPAPAPAPAPAPQEIVRTAVAATENTPSSDDDRPPPRVGGFKGRRMLDGENFE